MFEADPMYKVVPYKGMPETAKEIEGTWNEAGSLISNKPHHKL